MKQNDIMSNKYYIFEIVMILLAYVPYVYAHVPLVSWLMMIFVALLSLSQAIRTKLWCNSTVGVWWLFILWSIIGVIYTNDISYACGYVLKLILLCLTLSYFSSNKSIEKPFSWIIGFSFIAVSSIMLEVLFPIPISKIRNFFIVSSTDISSIEERIAAFSSKYGLFSDTAVSAFYCASGIGVGLYYYTKNKKAIATIWLVLSGAGIILTNKRGSMMSAAIALMVVYLLMTGVNIKKRVKAALVIVIIALFGLYLLNYNAYVIGWFRRINANVYSIRNRLSLYTRLWNNFVTHPIWGSGTKSSRMILGGIDGHNIYLAELSENGILGLILLLVAFYVSLKNTYSKLHFFREINDKSAEAITVFCIFMQLYIILYGITGNPMTTLYSLAMYFLCVGVPLRQYRIASDG